ncbi:hypothetical protein TUM15764_10940 [Neisseria gonorrhoeae]|uniref:general secretion pathway protein GspG n=1 Tax=Neisseria gonorrhoeae TaxID=485 RepID=UPI0014845943|nr:general secretion pathway protein GspG [Neisseria gonorrhoeae]GFL38090.1 hypothetical protein TUM15764_10940 [Neisseria gonorrhoeae]
MQILSFQADIAERMLEGTEGESVNENAQFVRTDNGYWIAWHEGVAALLAPDTPPGIPCFWVEGAESLEELCAMVERGEFDEVEEFDGDDDAWLEAAKDCGHHGEACACGH